LRHRTTRRFREAFADLPEETKKRARRAHRLLLVNPEHPGLQFKQVHPARPIYSARVGLAYRALGVRDNDDLIWFWIGTHADYDDLLRRL
jgi:hypothetical protein